MKTVIKIYRKLPERIRQNETVQRLIEPIIAKELDHKKKELLKLKWQMANLQSYTAKTIKKEN